MIPLRMVQSRWCQSGTANSSNAVKCMPSLPAAFTSLFLFLYQTLPIQLAGQHKATCSYIAMENTVRNMSQDTLLPEKS